MLIFSTTFEAGVINLISQMKKVMLREINRLASGQRSSIVRGGSKTQVDFKSKVFVNKK